MARVISVNSSNERKTRKAPRERVKLLSGFGIEGDAHAGQGHRQVSILSDASMARMRSMGIETFPGCCGENIDIGDCGEMYTMLPGVRFRIGASAEVRITEIGKDNSDGHADNVIRGNIFPDEGVFAEVLNDGEVRAGDIMEAVRSDGYLAAVLTVSDSASRGVYPDESGPAVMELLRKSGFQPARYHVEPDDYQALVSRMSAWCDDGFVDLILTAGGTGLSVRDVTPEATAEVCTRAVPGIPELMRLRSAEITRTAWLSRAFCGIRKRTLVVNLPGSLKASVECAGFIIPVLGHALEILRGDVAHCGHAD